MAQIRSASYAISAAQQSVAIFAKAPDDPHMGCDSAATQCGKNAAVPG
jgi:hypothetical protein